MIVTCYLQPKAKFQSTFFVHFVQGTAKLAKWTKKSGQSGQKKWTFFCFLSVFCKLYIIELSVGPTKCSEQLNTYCKHKIYFIGPLYTKFPNSVFKYFFFQKKKFACGGLITITYSTVKLEILYRKKCCLMLTIASG